jgi:demethylmenaquinone methyltransferase/2-methoxy-6-polyprenyl-1,4-benzoquinol methylase
MALKKMFSGIVGSYDLMNRLVSLGMDESWRRRAAEESTIKKPGLVLDIGTGTGDLAFHIKSRSGAGTEVIALDFSLQMLAEASEKRIVKGADVTLVAGDAAELPFKTGSVDCITTSFSFRNLIYKNPNSESYLREIRRVLSPSGIFVIVESSQPDSKLVRTLFHVYAKKVVPFVGAKVSGSKSAYRYLGHSMANFYQPEEVKKFLKEMGFEKITYRPLSFGLAGIYTATPEQATKTKNGINV